MGDLPILSNFGMDSCERVCHIVTFTNHHRDIMGYHQRYTVDGFSTKPSSEALRQA